MDYGTRMLSSPIGEIKNIIEEKSLVHLSLNIPWIKLLFRSSDKNEITSLHHREYDYEEVGVIRAHQSKFMPSSPTIPGQRRGLYSDIATREKKVFLIKK